ncbi:MAG: 4-hydroxy-3-methylbut-2-enyl diphosphate reductase [Spirochaetaceae bacterium]|jgi:4-hydroxy-3-methylbut-2-enyl diphosphate reductase|nr:4-hydroxy-3-methylbut-2-enyl diphosphate reductase [Spirochaetaceae bacterium]
MRIIRAGVLGYCMGVRRAVELAYREAAKSASPGGRVYTVGPLIHNPQVLEDLRRRGVEALDGAGLPGDLSGSAVIIRAHGITPELEAELVRRGAAIRDATCPKVKASQMKARALYRAGCRLFLAGERRHGEIIGIQGYAPDCVIVASRDEAEKEAAALAREFAAAAPQGNSAAPPKTALIAQTTFSPEEYRAIAGGIARHLPETEIINTICPATKDRQESLRSLCSAVDAVVIVGGRDSANTRRLLAIAESCGKPAWLVENAAAVPREAAAFPAVGLSAGASTPGEVIDSVEAALRRLASGA